jgi:hypothetical protein
MTKEISAPVYLTIGRKRYPFADMAACSAAFCKARDASGEGASTIPEVTVTDASGKAVATISYNGRVWPPEPWVAGMVPLYDPYA